MVVIGQSGFIREKVVVFGRKWLHSGKVDVFRKNGSIRAKWLYSGQSCCIQEIWLYSGNVLVIGQKLLYLGKVVLFRQ